MRYDKRLLLLMACLCTNNYTKGCCIYTFEGESQRYISYDLINY